MGNCLVTKLKGVVDNDYLIKMGEALIDVRQKSNTTLESQIFRLATGAYSYADQQFALEIIGDGYFSDTFGGESIGKTTILSGNKEEVYCSNGNYKIKVSNKYRVCALMGAAAIGANPDDFAYSTLDTIWDRSNNLAWNHLPKTSTLTQIAARFCPFSFDFAELVSNTNLVTIDVGGSNHHGDIANFAGLVNLISLDIYAPQGGRRAIYGDIASLGTLVNLQYMNVCYGTGISGTIESLVAAFRANGKTSGTINGDFVFCPTVTFNGQPLPDVAEYHELSWTSSTITCNGVTINA